MIHRTFKNRWWFQKRRLWKHLIQIRVWFSAVLPEIEIFLMGSQMASYLRKNLFTHRRESRDLPIRLNPSATGRSIHLVMQIAIYRTYSTCHWQRRRGQMQHPYRGKVDAICCFSATFFNPEFSRPDTDSRLPTNYRGRQAMTDPRTSALRKISGCKWTNRKILIISIGILYFN